MCTLRARYQRIGVTMAMAVVASTFVMSSAGSSPAGASQKAVDTTTTTTSTAPGPDASAPTPGIENDWSYWWLPTTPQGGPAVDNSPERHNPQPAIRWLNTPTVTNPRQITPPGSSFRTDGFVDIETSISGYYEITFSAHSRIRGSGTAPTWAFEGPSYQPKKEPEFPQCVAPSVTTGATGSGYFEAATTCVAKLTANYPYDWYLRTEVSLELQLPYASTLPVATLMIQLLTPTT